MFRFQKLNAWQKAMDWAQHIYAVTDTFPDHERYGLTAHLRKSGVSVPSNIAEGSGRPSDKDFARFLEISYGSLMEAVCQCMLAQRLGYLSAEELASLESEAEELARMLSGLRNSLAGSGQVKDDGVDTGYLASDS